MAYKLVYQFILGNSVNSSKVKVHNDAQTDRTEHNSDNGSSNPEEAYWCKDWWIDPGTCF